MHLTRMALYSLSSFWYIDEEYILGKKEHGFRREQSPQCLVEPRQGLCFDKVHQSRKENQILMITAQTSSGKVSKKISLLLFSIFYFLSWFKLASTWKVCSRENFNLLMLLALTVHSGLLCEYNG